MRNNARRKDEDHGDSGSVRAAKTGRKTNRSKTVIGGALTGKDVGMWMPSKLWK